MPLFTIPGKFLLKISTYLVLGGTCFLLNVFECNGLASRSLRKRETRSVGTERHVPWLVVLLLTHSSDHEQSLYRTRQGEKSL